MLWNVKFINLSQGLSPEKVFFGTIPNIKEYFHPSRRPSQQTFTTIPRGFKALSTEMQFLYSSQILKLHTLPSAPIQTPFPKSIIGSIPKTNNNLRPSRRPSLQKLFSQIYPADSMNRSAERMLGAIPNANLRTQNQRPSLNYFTKVLLVLSPKTNSNYAKPAPFFKLLYQSTIGSIPNNQ